MRKYTTFYYCAYCKKEIKNLAPAANRQYVPNFKKIEVKKDTTNLALWHDYRDIDGYPMMCGPIELRYDQDLNSLQFESLGEKL